MDIRPKAIKFLEANIGYKVLNISLGEEFLNLTPKAKGQQKQVEVYQTKKLHSKKTINKMKTQSSERKKVHANHISDRVNIQNI